MNFDFKKIMAAKPSPWYNIVPGEADTADRIDINGIIGGSWFGDGVTAKDFKNEVKQLTGNALEVHINSPGGSVADGLDIYNFLCGLKAVGKEVRTYADGIVASIATVIFQAGDKRIAAENAFLHVHNALMLCYGNAAAMETAAGELRKISDTIAKVYADRSGKETAFFSDLMTGKGKDDGTLLSAEEAKNAGLVDELQENKKIPAAAMRWDMLSGIPQMADDPEDPEAPADPETPEEPEEPEDPEEPEEPEAPADPADPEAPAAPAAPEEDPEEDPEDPEKENLRKRIEQLENQVAKIQRNALAPTPANEGTVIPWAEAMKNCGGNYAEARRKYPVSYRNFMKKHN